MIVGTTEAAQILKISTARLRVLLIAGRVEGAYKTGKMWLMPLFKGKPIIKRGTRGPAPRWRNPRTPAKTIIHVNSHKIRENQKQNQQQPVITVKKHCDLSKETLLTMNAATAAFGNADSAARKSQNVNLYGHEVEILGGCRVVYRPNSSKCGAKVWIETLYDVKVTCWD
ncbi:MAG: DNA-binding protein [Lyngbya sp.]|nr:DNA-binding protein [Lyngbya sp.]